MPRRRRCYYKTKTSGIQGWADLPLPASKGAQNEMIQIACGGHSKPKIQKK